MYTILDLEHKLGVKSYVIRFWENNFSEINPVIENNERFYSQRDFDLLTKIKQYLLEDELSVEEAQTKLKSAIPSPSSAQPQSDDFPFQEAPPKPVSDKEFLHSILKNLEAIIDEIRSGLE